MLTEMTARDNWPCGGEFCPDGTCSTCRSVWEQVKSDAYGRAMQPWGGATINNQTSATVPDNADAFAVTIKLPEVASFAITEDASWQAFSDAFDKARANFADAPYLGVFHDDAKGTIEFDPVAVVETTAQVDQIARTHPVIGGAYHFKTGDGYWPQGRPELYAA